MTDNVTVVKSIVSDKITVDTKGMVRIGGVCIGRRVEEQGVVYLEVLDRMKPRNEARGRPYVYVTMSSLVDALLGISNG